MDIRNIWLEGSAILLDCCLLYMLIFRKTTRASYSRYFFALFAGASLTGFVGFGHALTETLVTVGIVSGSGVRLPMLYFNYIYFAGRMFCCVIFALYEYAVLDIRYFSLKNKIMIYAPFGITMLSLLFNPLFHHIFYITSNGKYGRGAQIVIFYIAGLYYLAYIMSLAVRYGRNIRSDKSKAFGFLPLIPIFATMFQLYFPDYYIENFSLSLMLLLVYISIERPSDYIDSSTGLMNGESFYTNYSFSMNMNKHVTLLIVCIKNIDAWDRELGSHTTNMLLVDVAGFLSSLSNSTTVYCLNRGQFALCISLENTASNHALSSSLISSICERFQKPFSIKGYRITFSETTCILDCPEDVGPKGHLADLIRACVLESASSKHRLLNIRDLTLNRSDRERIILSRIRSVSSNRCIRFTFLPEYNLETEKFDSVKTELTLHVSSKVSFRPNIFFPIAERNGLIYELNAHILDSFFSLISRSGFVEAGIRNVNILLPISVLANPNEIEQIEALADNYGVPRSLICFEISKNSIISYERQIVQSMKCLSETGFKFILENYGNGYTNAATLIEMPIHAVTIDNRLTEAALSSEMANKLVRSTIRFLKDFGIKVKADHLEKQASDRYARESGFDYLQGYYFSKPLGAEELVEFLKGDH